jgi:hypothetical protein
MAMRINRSLYLRMLLKNEMDIIPNAANRITTEFGRLDAHNLRAIYALSMINQKINQRGGELHVLLIPQNFLLGKVKRPHIDPAYEDKIDDIRVKCALMKALVNQCNLARLRCHDLMSILTLDDYFIKDAHWNEQGHHKIGQYVADLINRECSPSL